MSGASMMIDYQVRRNKELKAIKEAKEKRTAEEAAAEKLKNELLAEEQLAQLDEIIENERLAEQKRLDEITGKIEHKEEKKTTKRGK